MTVTIVLSYILTFLKTDGIFHNDNNMLTLIVTFSLGKIYLITCLKTYIVFISRYISRYNLYIKLQDFGILNRINLLVLTT